MIFTYRFLVDEFEKKGAWFRTRTVCRADYSRAYCSRAYYSRTDYF